MSSYNLYNVMSKEVLLTVRTRPEIRDEFKKVAELRGASMSTLIHQFMVGLIREEKDREPKAFIEIGLDVYAGKENSREQIANKKQSIAVLSESGNAKE